MQYQIEYTSRFKKEYKLAKKGRDISLLRAVIEILAKGETLPEKYRDHPLENSRNYKGMRECHIKPDWLLIYKIYSDRLVLELIRTGAHSDLF